MKDRRYSSCFWFIVGNLFFDVVETLNKQALPWADEHTFGTGSPC